MTTTALAMGKGVGDLFKAYLLGPQLRAQAQNAGAPAPGLLDQRASVTRENDAQTALLASQLAAQSPDGMLETALGQAGMDQSQRPAISARLRSGLWPQNEYGQPEGTGLPPETPRAPPVNDETLANLARSIALMQRTTATKSNVAQEASAGQTNQQTSMIDRVMADPTLAGAVATAQAAGHGKPLFDATGTTGQSLQTRTGAPGPANDVLARLYESMQLTDRTRKQAQAGASNAAAGAAGARAGASRSSSGLTEDRRAFLKANERMPGTGGSGEDATNAKAKNQLARDVDKRLGPTATDAEWNAEYDKGAARRGMGTAPARKPATTTTASTSATATAPAAAKIDMGAAEGIKAKFKAGKITRDEARAALKKLGMD